MNLLSCCRVCLVSHTHLQREVGQFNNAINVFYALTYHLCVSESSGRLDFTYEHYFYSAHIWKSQQSTWIQRNVVSICLIYYVVFWSFFFIIFVF